MKTLTFKEKIWGFVLVETLISLAIISVGSLGLINLQGKLIKSRSLANQNNQALVIAIDKIEQLRNYSTKSKYNEIISINDSVQKESALYYRKLIVTTNTNPNYKVANVSVSWMKQDGNFKTINLQSNIAELSIVNSGKAMKTISALSLKSPPNDNYIGNQGNQGNQGNVVTNEDTQEESEPTVDVDNIETTTSITDSGVALVFDNSTNNIITIDGYPAVTISGSINKASGGNSPAGNHNMDEVIVTASGNGSSFCSYANSENDIVSYTCHLQRTFSGTINISGIINVKVCGKQLNSYNNQLVSISGQDYTLFKTNKSCSGSTSYEITTL